MTGDARHPGDDVHGYIRDREDAIRRDLLAELERVSREMHQRIGKRRQELEDFRREDFATLGAVVVGHERDLARGQQPGWVAMEFASIAAALLETREGIAISIRDARAGAEGYTDTEIAAVATLIATLSREVVDNRSALTWFQRTAWGAMFVAMVGLAVQVLTLASGR